MIMKKFLFILTVITCFFASSVEARRVRFTIPVDNSIPKVVTLPDSSYYKTDEGSHLDLGYIEEDGKRTLYYSLSPSLILITTFRTIMQKLFVGT